MSVAVAWRANGVGPVPLYTAARGGIIVWQSVGSAAASTTDYTLTAGAGSYTLTGHAASFPVARMLTAGTGSYRLTGHAARLSTTANPWGSVSQPSGTWVATADASGTWTPVN